MPPLAAAVLALAAPLAAFAAQLLLRPAIYRVPYVLFFLATALTAWLGGPRAAAIATLVGGVLGNVFFVAPYGELSLGGAELLASSLFLGVGAVMTLLAAQVRGHAAAARATQRQLEAILASIADGLTVQRRDGSLAFANDAAARVSGFRTAAEMLAVPIAELARRYEVYDEDGRPFDWSKLPGRRALAGEGPQTAIMKVRDRSSGELRWTMVTAAPVPDGAGQPLMAVNVFRDVTAGKRTEEMQRFAAESATALASSLDVQATLRTMARLAVPALADWCGIDLATAGGGIERLETAHVDPAKVELAKELQRRYPIDPAAPRGVPQVLRTGKPELIAEISDELLRAAARDEEHLRVAREIGMRSAIIAPIVGRERTLGAITLVSAESGRRYDATDLAFAVELGARAGLALENARLYGDALEALRLRDAFIAVAGHELRTPLAALLLQVQGMQLLAARRRDDPDIAKLAARLDKSEANVRRLDRLVRELLDVTRIAAGRLALSREPFDLVELVHEVVERHRATAARVSFTVEGEAALPGRWDRLRLDQVLTNLLSNAVKYGEGRPVTVRVARRDGGAELRVADRGIGIARADLARVFERFVRAVPEKSYAGLGLGLWITAAIVAAHGGAIRAESEPGQGSTFIVELPLDGEST